MAKQRQNLFSKLTQMFKSGPLVKRKIEGIKSGDVASSALAVFRKSAASIYGSSVNSTGQFDRLSRLADYSEMDSLAEVSKALDIYADESVAKSEKGFSLHIFSENPKIKNLLEDLFFDTLNFEFSGRAWIRNLIKFGDFFLLLDVSPKYGVINVFPIPLNEMEREEGFDPEDPSAVRFRWITNGNQVLQNWEVIHFRLMGNDTFLPYGSSLLESARRPFRQLVMAEDAMLAYRIIRCLHGDTNIWTENGYKKIKDIKVGDKVYSYDHMNNSLILSNVSDWVNNGKQKIYCVKTLHRSIKTNENHPILVLNKKTNIIDYVQVKNLSLEHQAIKPSFVKDYDNLYEDIISVNETEEYADVYDIRVDNNLHNFIADGIVVHNSPERRVFYIDVGNAPPNDIPNIMESAKASLKSQEIADNSVGRTDRRFQPYSVDIDYFIPVRGNESNTRVDTLAGGQNTTAIDDVEYIQRKLIAALGVPKTYLNFDDDLGGKANLATVDIRFSRSIQSIQQVIITELNKIAAIHLASYGYEGEDLLNFKIQLSNPSTMAQQQKLELMRTRFEIAGMQPENKLTDEYIYKEVFELTDDQIEKMEQRQIVELMRRAQLEKLGAAAAEEGSDFGGGGGGSGFGGLGGGSGAGGLDLAGLEDDSEEDIGGDEGDSEEIEDIDLEGGEEDLFANNSRIGPLITDEEDEIFNIELGEGESEYKPVHQQNQVQRYKHNNLKPSRRKSKGSNGLKMTNPGDALKSSDPHFNDIMGKRSFSSATSVGRGGRIKMTDSVDRDFDSIENSEKIRTRLSLSTRSIIDSLNKKISINNREIISDNNVEKDSLIIEAEIFDEGDEK